MIKEMCLEPAREMSFVNGETWSGGIKSWGWGGGRHTHILSSLAVIKQITHPLGGGNTALFSQQGRSTMAKREQKGGSLRSYPTRPQLLSG